MRIVLHLGAHKTATTYIQTVLAANRDALRSAGIGYVPLDDLRAGLTAKVGRSNAAVRSELRKLVDRHDDCHRLIVSDENLAGMCANAVRAGGYYVEIDERIGRLVEAAQGHDVEILYATRSYPDFISSMYCEYLRIKPFITIGEYLETVDVEGFSWRRSVGTLASLVGEQSMTLWRFEDFRKIESRVFSALCGPAVPALTKPPTSVHESLSAKAVDALAALIPVLEREEIRALVRPVSASLSKAAGYPAFRAFDPQRASGMQQTYARDMTAIAGEFPQLAMLQPGTAMRPRGVPAASEDPSRAAAVARGRPAAWRLWRKWR